MACAKTVRTRCHVGHEVTSKHSLTEDTWARVESVSKTLECDETEEEVTWISRLDNIQNIDNNIYC